MQRMDTFALVLASIGAIVWGVTAFFGINPVEWLNNNQTTESLNRIVFSIIAIAGIWSIRMLFKRREEVAEKRR